MSMLEHAGYVLEDLDISGIPQLPGDDWLTRSVTSLLNISRPKSIVMGPVLYDQRVTEMIIAKLENDETVESFRFDYVDF